MAHELMAPSYGHGGCPFPSRSTRLTLRAGPCSKAIPPPNTWRCAGWLCGVRGSEFVTLDAEELKGDSYRLRKAKAVAGRESSGVDHSVVWWEHDDNGYLLLSADEQEL